MKLSITILTMLLVNVFTQAQQKAVFVGTGTAITRWGDPRLNFGTVTSPQNKTGERATYASFELLDPYTNNPIPSQFRDKATAAVFYSTNQAMLERFRRNIQNKELQDIVLPIESRAGAIYKTGAHRMSTANNKANFRAIFPHENHPQFQQTTGKFPRGTKVYFFWVFGAPYKDSVTFHVDPDEQHPKPVTRVKYFYNTITDNGVRPFVMPRELIVAVAGESNSSGEGAPSPGNMPWADGNCHRSLQSGMFLGVQSYVNAHPELSIVYKDYFVGCSGADISDLINDQAGGKVAQFSSLSNTRTRNNLPNAAIDVLLLSIGGNDINFHDIIFLLLFPGPELNASLIRNQVGVEPAELMKTLKQRLELLNTGIKTLKVRKTFLMGYPDLTHSTTQTFCGLPFALDAATIILNLAEDVAKSGLDEVCPGDCFSTPVLDYFSNRARCLGVGVWSFVEQLIDLLGNLDNWDDWLDNATGLGDFVIELGSTKMEYEYCYEDMLLKLNKTIEDNCQLYNWGYMAGAAEKTKAHGYCNCSDPYFNTYGKSYILQNDKKGTAHLNKKAHGLVNKVIVENTLTSYLTDASNRIEATIEPGSNPNMQRVLIDPQLKQKAENAKAVRAANIAKLQSTYRKNKQMIMDRSRKLKPQLLQLKNYFHQKALKQ